MVTLTQEYVKPVMFPYSVHCPDADVSGLNLDWSS